MDAFHTEKRIYYQCWNCHKQYARKENVMKHSQKIHGDAEKKFIVVETTNRKYKPYIFKPEAWIPPPEARTRKGSVHRIYISRTAPIKTPDPQTEDNSTKEPEYHNPLGFWLPFTVKEIDRIFKTKVTTDMLMEDLYLSSSDTSISSGSTDCQDEDNINKTVTAVQVYNVFH